MVNAILSDVCVLVPQKKVFEGRVFEKLEANGVELALGECQSLGFEPVFTPELIDARLYAKVGDYVLNNWFTTPSLIATGRGISSNVSKKGGSPFVVVAHVPNYFSDAGNIRANRLQGLIKNGAGVLPQSEFQRLLDLKDDQHVFVVDYETWTNASNGLIKVSKALSHPQVIPFLGGEDRAKLYLKKHQEVYGDNIGVWHVDDLDVQPRGRLSFVGNDCGNGLDGSNHVNYFGRVVGVVSAGGALESPRSGAPKSETLDAKVLVALNSKKGFEHDGTLYLPVDKASVPQ